MCWLLMRRIITLKKKEQILKSEGSVKIRTHDVDDNDNDK